jgi:hypothetical protein
MTERNAKKNYGKLHLVEQEILQIRVEVEDFLMGYE